MRLIVTLCLGLAAATTFVGAARADVSCPPVPAENWMSLEQAAAKARDLGYTAQGIERDDGCWEVSALDRQGVKVEFKMHPVTGEVVTRMPAGSTPQR